MSTTAEPSRRTTFREAVAEEIRAALARRRMSASALARKLGKSQTYVWRRLSGETAFDTDDLEAIAAALSVTVVDLLPPDARQGSRVTGWYRELSNAADLDGTNVRPLAGEPLAGRTDLHRRPRRPARPHPPMPIMQRLAA